MQGKLTRIIAEELNLDEDQYEIISYGAFAFTQIIISIAAVAFFGMIFGVLMEALIVSFSTSILRQYSGGVHAGKPLTCVVIGTMVSVGLAVFAKYIGYFLSIQHYIAILPVFFMGSFYIIYKNAPVDSVAKPIRSEIKRKKMKRKSYIVVILYLFFNIAFLLSYGYMRNNRFLVYSLDIYGGMLFQIFSLTIIGHKILGKMDKAITLVLYKRGGELK